MKASAVLSSLQTVLSVCRERDFRPVICYKDAGGHTMLLWREIGAWLGSLDVAQNKAWTAVAFSGPESKNSMPTLSLAQLCQPGASLYGLQNTNEGRVVIFGGGVPVYVDNRLHGGIGVSGMQVEDDQIIADIAVASYLNALAE